MAGNGAEKPWAICFCDSLQTVTSKAGEVPHVLKEEDKDKCECSEARGSMWGGH